MAWLIVMDDSAAVRRRFLEGITRAMGCGPGVLDRVGTTVCPGEERAGTGIVLAYHVGLHTVLWCDPAFAERLKPLESDTEALSDADFRSWARDVGGAIGGQAVMKTRGATHVELLEKPGVLHHFDWTKASDLALVRELIDDADVDDLDEAELALDELDELAVGLLDDQGRVAAFASSRPFGYGQSFGDIGVMTRADVRGGGWGRAAVAGLMDEVLVPAGFEPLYRCDPANHGSDRLSDALGFEPVLTLTAVEFSPG